MTRSRALGVALAVVSVAFAACGGHSTSPSPGGTPTPTPIATVSGSLASPCALSFGEAYVPDNGNGAGFNGVQVAHFQDNSQYLCGTVPSQPSRVTFAAPVGDLAFSADVGFGLSDALALLLGPGGYRYAQDVFGADIGQIVPVGTAYDLGSPPTPAPTASGATPNPSASPTAPLITNGSSVAILGSGQGAVGLVTGPAATAIVALTSLTLAPPQYGSNVPFAGSNYTLKPGIPPDSYSIVRVSGDGLVALLRGQSHLVSFGISVVATGYQFDAKAQDPSLGYGAIAPRGAGAIAFDPASSSRALVGTGNVLTLVTGLPTAITETAHLTLPGTTIRSVRIASNGIYAVAATDAGIVVVSGVDGSALSPVTPFTSVANGSASEIPYVNCAGQPVLMSNVYGVGFSAGSVPGTTNDYLVALGSSNPAPAIGGACVYPASVVAIPFNPSTGSTPSPSPTVAPSPGSTASPIPRQFTQNNVIAPPAGVDDFFVH